MYVGIYNYPADLRVPEIIPRFEREDSVGKLVIENGKVVLPSQDVIKEVTVVIKDDKIAKVVPPEESGNFQYPANAKNIDASGNFVSPGFIDLQVNGGAGADFLEASDEELETFGKKWASTGCTGFLATIITERLEKMRSAIETFVKIELKNFIGVHLEGPFISRENKGTHDPKFIQSPDETFLERLLHGFTNTIKLFTLAPELPGSKNLIEKLENLNIAVSLGHSSATFEEAMEALNRGLKSFTHLYNAMTGLHHRNPGCVGAALTSNAYTGLIADGMHVHPTALRIANIMKNPGKLYLVTDAISAAGLKEGKYELGGQKITVENGIARLQDGTISGSTLTMNQAIQNYMKFTEANLPEAVRAASSTPAKLIGMDQKKGTIEPDKDADLVLFDENFQVLKTIIGGEVVFDNES